jgi:phosphotransferase system enzyme I (PtsI)
MAQMQILRGIGVSRGIAIGRAVVVETLGPHVFCASLDDHQIAAEIERLQQAAEAARHELERMRAKVGEDFGSDLAGIFDAHVLLLTDRKFIGRVEERIRAQRVNAEWAVHKTAEELDERFASMGDDYLRQRGADLADVSRHLLRSLQGSAHRDLAGLLENTIIVADDLTPSDAIRLGREHVRGFAIETGGRTSHTSIIAQSLNLPAVAGVDGLTALLSDQDPLIIDGERGEVVVHPTPEVIEQYRRQQSELERQEIDLKRTCDMVAETRDGVLVQLMANIDLPEEIDEVREYGAAGVGLYRSEFLYIEKSPLLPSEDEHIAIYRRLIEAAAPQPAIIRTYDLGGRKLAREMLETHEENPVLGLRGIRLTLARPAVFRTQIRALLRAGLYGDLWVMLPMVSTVEEVRHFRAFAAEAMRELEAEGLPFRRELRLGVMIEVPAAAVIADLLARQVDFFAVGTNDLIQYSLAVDRNNEHVAYLYQPFHPAMLRMLRYVIDSARAANIEISLCGEMAGELRSALLLVGMGLRRLSMTPRRIPAIKTQLCKASAAELAEMAARCMQFETAAEVQAYLEAALAAPSLQEANLT